MPHVAINSATSHHSSLFFHGLLFLWLCSTCPLPVPLSLICPLSPASFVLLVPCLSFAKHCASHLDFLCMVILVRFLYLPSSVAPKRLPHTTASMLFEALPAYYEGFLLVLFALLFFCLLLLLLYSQLSLKHSALYL